MPQKKHTPEEIVARLRQVDVLISQGRSVAEAVRSISVMQFAYCRWRKEFGGLKTGQVERLKELGKDRAIGSSPMARERLRKAVSDLTLEKPILREAGPVPVSFRSSESDALTKGGRIWQRHTARNSSVKRFALRSPAA